MERELQIILDTHIFLWAISNPNKIEKNKQKKIQSLSNTIYISAISVVELMIKDSIAKIVIDFNPIEIAKKSGFEMLDFAAEDALILKELPFHHRDPFDRMIIAQSIRNKFSIITNDQKFNKYECKLIGKP